MDLRQQDIDIETVRRQRHPGSAWPEHAGGDASATTASAGARGLDKASEGYADRAGVSARDREVVDRMTAYQIPDQDVEEFMREGGLGEYAK